MEVLPNTLCQVELPNGHRILAYRSGPMRRSRVEISPGDRVKVEMSPFDMSKGRIMNRVPET